jgi:hypothetical protein
VGNENDHVMGHRPASPSRLSQGEQRALASFYAGRLPAGQLHAELCRAREAALAALASAEVPPEASPEAPSTAVPAPALHAA